MDGVLRGMLERSPDKIKPFRVSERIFARRIRRIRRKRAFSSSREKPLDVSGDRRGRQSSRRVAEGAERLKAMSAAGGVARLKTTYAGMGLEDERCQTSALRGSPHNGVSALEA